MPLVVIATVFALASGCTQGVAAYIRIAAHDFSKVDHSVRLELERLGWTEVEGSLSPGGTHYENASLRYYYLTVRHTKESTLEILFRIAGTKYFTPDAVDAYRLLVARLQADPNNEVKYDVQTSSGQWIGDSGSAR